MSFEVCSNGVGNGVAEMHGCETVKEGVCVALDSEKAAEGGGSILGGHDGFNGPVFVVLADGFYVVPATNAFGGLTMTPTITCIVKATQPKHGLLHFSSLLSR
jgi:hypothetical protein